MRRNDLILISLVIVAGALAVLRPSWGWEIRNLISAGPPPSSSDLLAENANLKAKLAELSGFKPSLPSPLSASILAVVFSRYPMNFKEEILVGAGSEEGVRVGSAVTLNGILIGKVETVFSHSSLVMTVFDSRFETAVRVGDSSADGLFEGGAVPNVTLISKKSAVAAGDAVYSAASGWPYGLALGELGPPSVSQNQLFSEASVVLPYDLNDARMVSIVNFFE